MKTRQNLFIFLLLFTAISAFAQESKVKMQFGVLGENGNFFANLKASDIQISQNKKTLQPVSLEAKTETSLEIIIMIDASISQERMLPDEKKAAKYFIDNILKSGKDKVAIVRFSGKISLEQDLTADFTKAKEQLGKIKFEPPAGYIGGGIIAGIPANTKPDAAGSTSIWDSIKQVSEAIAKVKAGSARRAILLISDGVNTFGDAKLKEAVAVAVKTQIPIFAIGIGDELYAGVDRESLKKITGQTGGVSIIPKGELKNLPEQIKKIENSLRTFYEVTFSPNAANSKDALQEAEIEIINPELRKQKLQILQPKGFFLEN
jgi:Ca-activated chloride channel family protein